jgi:hypothetical protein
MKRIFLIAAMALFVVMPLAAQSSTSEDPQTAETPVVTEADPQDPQSDSSEVAGKVESMSEAFVEMKNILDALNKLKISGYIQAQYVDDESSEDVLTSPTATRNRDQFSIRRARIKFVYSATPWARFTFQPEVTSSGTSLKDAFVELTEQKTPWKNTLTAGQFNWPFGFEIAYSSSNRELPERSRVIRTLFPGERDRGVQLSGSSPNSMFNYKLAVVNGTGTAQSFDFNSDKDILGRLGLNLGAIDLGVSGYEGTDLVANSTAPAGVEFDKTRQGVDFQWVTPLPGLLARGEYIQGEERGADVDGWYAYLVQNIGTRHQVAVRVDEYDPNTERADNATRTLGASYIFHVDPHSKIMFAYEKPELEVNDPDDNVATIRFQYAF